MSSFSAVTRPTRRDMVKHPWRSLAGLLLVALPVAALIAFGIGTSSESQFSSLMYSMDRTISPASPEFDNGSERNFRDVANEALPGDLQASPVVNFFHGPVRFGSKSAGTTFSQFDVDNPPAEAAVLLEHYKLQPGQVLLSADTAKKIGADVGNVVEVSGGKEAKVAGIVPGVDSYATAPALVSDEDLDHNPGQAMWAIVGSHQLTEDDAEALAKKGLALYDSHLDSNSDVTPSLTGDEILFLLFVASVYSFAAFLVLVLVAPVFSFALGKNLRLYALMASQGASPKHIAAAVLAYGFLTGVVGATIGAVLGFAIGIAAWCIRFPSLPLDIPWLMSAEIWAIAVLGSTCAAAIPAWLAARSALTTAIQGGRPDRIVHWRKEMAYGPMALPILVLLSLTPAGQKLFGPLGLLAFIAVGASAPALIFAASRLCSHGGLALRLAGRGLLRRGMRTIPTAVALLAITFTAAAGSVISFLDAAKWEEQSTLVNPGSTAIIATDDYSNAVDNPNSSAETAAADAALAQKPGHAMELRGYVDPYSAHLPDSQVPSVKLTMEYDFVCEQTDPTDNVEEATFIDRQGRTTDTSAEAREACAHEMMTWLPTSDLMKYGRTLEATPETLDLFNFDSPADKDKAAATLEQGGIVLAHGRHLEGRSEARFTAERAEQRNGSVIGSATAKLPAVEALPTFARDVTLISPGAAEKLNIKAARLGTAVAFNETPTPKEREGISFAVEQASGGTHTISFTGTPQSDEWAPAAILAVLSVLALVFIIANTAVAMRREADTYNSLGAPLSLMAKVSAWQTWIIAGVSMLTGYVLGQAVGVFLSEAPRNLYNSNPYSINGIEYFQPDRWMLLVVIAAPLAGAAISALSQARGRGGDITARDRDEQRALA
ncbi:TPA: FtsX-like permease family protein [Corynebacterium striatum]|nr:FtsX-like permease family protein [Corynebacterium striatum]HAT1506533.1 FtsX-like permease family protein [Corynebacterium striatum]